MCEECGLQLLYIGVIFGKDLFHCPHCNIYYEIYDGEFVRLR